MSPLDRLLFFFVTWGHVAQTAVALLLAGFLFFFARSYSRRFLFDWSWSWGGLAAYHLGTAVVLGTIRFRELAALSMGASIVSQVGGFLHVACLVWGLLSLGRAEAPKRSYFVASLAGASLLGAASTLLTLSSSLEVRLFARVGLYSFVVFVVFAWLAVAMLRRNRELPSLGARVLCFGAVLYSTEHLLYFGLRLLVLAGTSPALTAWAQKPQLTMVALVLVDLVTLTTIALGTAVWLLEEERARFKESSDMLRLSQARLRKAHRLEAIGRIAGGLAHDFNNLMTTVLGYSQLLLTRYSSQEPLVRDLRQIQTAGERAAQLTRQLLAFSRRQMLRPEVIDANGMLRKMAQEANKHFAASATQDYSLRLELAEDLWRISADASQLSLIIKSLVDNSVDSMPAGGEIVISSANVRMRASDLDEMRPMPVGRYVQISVQDTGVGMDRSILEQLFEPFFSTKARGKGAGLGLATAYGVVKQSGGYIFAESEVDHGTTMRVFLPPATPEDRQRMVREQWDPSRGFVGTETVMVVEDDAAVRGLVEAILLGKGYHVLVAADGREALDAASREAESLRLVVTDMVMPDLSGPEVVDGLKQLVPDLRVIYMSGHSGDEMLLRGTTNEQVPFLEKPFSAERLLSEIRRTLDD